MLAAPPAWFADNVTQLAAGLLLVLTVVVVWLVHKIALRATLLALIVTVALLVYVNRDPLGACAQTCECQIGGRDITVPGCGRDPGL